MDSDSVTSLYAEARAWLAEDWRRVEESLGDQVARFFGKRILITGAAGFLGFGFLHFFSYLNTKQVERNRVRLVAADNFLRGRPRWLTELAAVNPDMRVVRQDITQPWPESAGPLRFYCAWRVGREPEILSSISAGDAGYEHQWTAAHARSCQAKRERECPVL